MTDQGSETPRHRFARPGTRRSVLKTAAALGVLGAGATGTANAQSPWRISSRDGTVSVRIVLGDGLGYGVSRGGSRVLNAS